MPLHRVLALWLTLWAVVFFWAGAEAAQHSIALPQDERIQGLETKGEALFVVEASEAAGGDQDGGESSRGAASPLGVPILDQLLLWLGIEDLTSLPEFDVPMIPNAALVFNVHTEEARRKDLVAPSSIDAYLRMTLREW